MSYLFLDDISPTYILAKTVSPIWRWSLAYASVLFNVFSKYFITPI